MYILGVSCSNDGTAALIKDGEILAAAGEERFSRIKQHLGFPRRAILSCLEKEGVKAEEIDLVVIPFQDYLKSHPFYVNALMSANGCFDIENEISLWDILRELIRQILRGDRLSFSTSKFSDANGKISEEIFKKNISSLGIKNAKIVSVDHHLAHAASAYYTSGFEKCLIITADGCGDGESATVSMGKSGEITKLYASSEVESAGVFYTAVTKYLGFKAHRHEGKITGLAAYGDPKVHYELMEKCIRVEDKTFRVGISEDRHLPLLRNFVDLIFGRFLRIPQLRNTVNFFQKNLQGAKREDVAAAAQKRLEDCFVEYIRSAVVETGVGKIALAGGVFANVKLNQRIAEIQGVEEIFIHPDMGDGGTALGGAFICWSENIKKENKVFYGKPLDNVYFGVAYDNAEIEKVLKKYGLKYRLCDHIEKEVAKLLAEKKIIGRFNGKFEYGPRALGNRSILAEPTDTTINDWLNKRLKRTEFMPFAPSVLDRAAPKLYKNFEKGKYTSEFMTITFDVDPIAQKMAPAVCHIDGTARPQIVTKRQNPSYYSIIEEFEKLTGIPLVVNTSFNMHEEPIVNTPEDAVRAFLLGSVDYLAIGNYLVGKS